MSATVLLERIGARVKTSDSCGRADETLRSAPSDIDMRLSVSYGWGAVPMQRVRVTPDEILVTTANGDTLHYPKSAIRSITPHPEFLAGANHTLRIRHGVPARSPWISLVNVQGVYNQLEKTLVAYGYPLRPSDEPVLPVWLRVALAATVVLSMAALLWLIAWSGAGS